MSRNEANNAEKHRLIAKISSTLWKYGQCDVTYRRAKFIIAKGVTTLYGQLKTCIPITAGNLTATNADHFDHFASMIILLILVSHVVIERRRNDFDITFLITFQITFLLPAT